MALRPSVRFDVFKRDSFTCQYCGRRTPDVVLEVDHIIPRAEGGGDELSNLATSCWECNRGKGPTPLDRGTARDNIAAKAELVREREQQLRAYNAAKAEEKARLDAELAHIANYWRQRVDGYQPWPNTIRWAVNKLGVVEVEEAVDLVAERYLSRSQAPRYFAGIVKRKVAQRDGRVLACAVCGEWLVLEPGQDTTLEWVHGSCAERNRG